MDISKIKLLLNTVKYLKPIQVYYRFYYFFRNRLFSIDVDEGFLPPFTLINWESKLKSSLSYTHKGKSFSFLNVTHQFSEQIDLRRMCFRKKRFAEKILQHIYCMKGKLQGECKVECKVKCITGKLQGEAQDKVH